MYSVSDLTGALATRNAGTFPLVCCDSSQIKSARQADFFSQAAIYLQAMNNNISATMGLLFIVLLSGKFGQRNDISLRIGWALLTFFSLDSRLRLLCDREYLVVFQYYQY